MKLFRQNGCQRSRDSQNGTLGNPRFASLASDNAWSADRKGAEADLLNVSLHFSFGPGIEGHRVGRGSNGGHEGERFYTGTVGRLREDKRECIVDIAESLLRTCLRLRRSQGANDRVHVPGLHSRGASSSRRKLTGLSSLFCGTKGLRVGATTSEIASLARAWLKIVLPTRPVAPNSKSLMVALPPPLSRCVVPPAQLRLPSNAEARLRLAQNHRPQKFQTR